MELRIENVSFSYDGERGILNNVSMDFPTSGMTAIVGESGCGKSTVVGLLTGALRPIQGTVTAGGKRLGELSREAYYSRLAVVSCGTYVFNTTVRENFKLAKRDVTDKEMTAALEKVNLTDFVRENGGFDREITEDATNISGGQKQRLALAINLVADKDIYIFDEATSNIDMESEAVIMRNITALSKTKNVIVISHRLENILPADRIYFMANGTVSECGTHSELMKKHGGYCSLYTAQKRLEQGCTEV